MRVACIDQNGTYWGVIYEYITSETDLLLAFDTHPVAFSSVQFISFIETHSGSQE
jgi:hypothetical protein